MPKLSKDIVKDISNDVNSVMVRVETLSKDIFDDKKGLVAQITANVNQQFEHAFRDYLNLFDDMLDARDFTPVPSIIAIVPAEGGNILKQDLFKKSMNLSLYCEHDKGVHKTEYYREFKITREWWEKNARGAGKLFDVLRVGLTVTMGSIAVLNPDLVPGMSVAISSIYQLAGMPWE